MKLLGLIAFVVSLGSFAVAATGQAAEIRANNQPAQLDIRPAGENSVRVTLKPISFKPDFPFTPALAEREYAAPSISLREISRPVKAQVGGLNVEVLATPLTIVATTADGKPIQNVFFQEDGNLSFNIGGQPVLGWAKGARCQGETFARFPSSGRLVAGRRGLVQSFGREVCLDQSRLGRRPPSGLLSSATRPWAL